MNQAFTHLDSTGHYHELLGKLEACLRRAHDQLQEYSAIAATGTGTVMTTSSDTTLSAPAASSVTSTYGPAPDFSIAAALSSSSSPPSSSSSCAVSTTLPAQEVNECEATLKALEANILQCLAPFTHNIEQMLLADNKDDAQARRGDTAGLFSFQGSTSTTTGACSGGTPSTAQGRPRGNSSMLPGAVVSACCSAYSLMAQILRLRRGIYSVYGVRPCDVVASSIPHGSSSSSSGEYALQGGEAGVAKRSGMSHNDEKAGRCASLYAVVRAGAVLQEQEQLYVKTAMALQNAMFVHEDGDAWDSIESRQRQQIQEGEDEQGEREDRREIESQQGVTGLSTRVGVASPASFFSSPLHPSADERKNAARVAPSHPASVDIEQIKQGSASHPQTHAAASAATLLSQEEERQQQPQQLDMQKSLRAHAVTSSSVPFPHSPQPSQKMWTDADLIQLSLTRGVEAVKFQQLSVAANDFALIVKLLFKKCFIVEELVLTAIAKAEVEEEEEENKKRSTAEGARAERGEAVKMMTGSNEQPGSYASTRATNTDRDSNAVIDDDDVPLAAPFDPANVMMMLPPGLDEEDYEGERAYHKHVEGLTNTGNGGSNDTVTATLGSRDCCLGSGDGAAAGGAITTTKATAATAEGDSKTAQWLGALLSKVHPDALPLDTLQKHCRLDLRKYSTVVGHANSSTNAAVSAGNYSKVFPQQAPSSGGSTVTATSDGREGGGARGRMPPSSGDSLDIISGGVSNGGGKVSTLQGQSAERNSASRQDSYMPTLKTTLDTSLPSSPESGGSGGGGGGGGSGDDGVHFSLTLLFARLVWNIAFALWEDGYVEDAHRWLAGMSVSRLQEVVKKAERDEEDKEKKEERLSAAAVDLSLSPPKTRYLLSVGISNNVAEAATVAPWELSWRYVLSANSNNNNNNKRDRQTQEEHSQPPTAAEAVVSCGDASALGATTVRSLSQVGKRLICRIAALRDLCAIVQGCQSTDDVLYLIQLFHRALVTERAVQQQQQQLEKERLREREEVPAATPEGLSDAMAEVLIALNIVVEFVLAKRARHFYHKLEALHHHNQQQQQQQQSFLLSTQEHHSLSSFSSWEHPHQGNSGQFHFSYSGTGGTSAPQPQHDGKKGGGGKNIYTKARREGKRDQPQPQHDDEREKEELENVSMRTACNEMVCAITAGYYRTLQALEVDGLPSQGDAGLVLAPGLPYVLGVNTLTSILNYVTLFRLSKIYRGVAMTETRNGNDSKLGMSSLKKRHNVVDGGGAHDNQGASVSQQQHSGMAAASATNLGSGNSSGSGFLSMLRDAAAGLMSTVQSPSPGMRPGGTRRGSNVDIAAMATPRSQQQASSATDCSIHKDDIGSDATHYASMSTRAAPPPSQARAAAAAARAACSHNSSATTRSEEVEPWRLSSSAEEEEGNDDGGNTTTNSGHDKGADDGSDMDSTNAIKRTSRATFVCLMMPSQRYRGGIPLLGEEQVVNTAVSLAIPVPAVAKLKSISPAAAAGGGGARLKRRGYSSRVNLAQLDTQDATATPDMPPSSFAALTRTQPTVTNASTTTTAISSMGRREQVSLRLLTILYRHTHLHNLELVNPSTVDFVVLELNKAMHILQLAMSTRFGQGWWQSWKEEKEAEIRGFYAEALAEVKAADETRATVSAVAHSGTPGGGPPAAMASVIFSPPAASQHHLSNSSSSRKEKGISGSLSATKNQSNEDRPSCSASLSSSSTSSCMRFVPSDLFPAASRRPPDEEARMVKVNVAGGSSDRAGDGDDQLTFPCAILAEPFSLHTSVATAAAGAATTRTSPQQQQQQHLPLRATAPPPSIPSGDKLPSVWWGKPLNIPDDATLQRNKKKRNEQGQVCSLPPFNHPSALTLSPPEKALASGQVRRTGDPSASASRAAAVHYAGSPVMSAVNWDVPPSFAPDVVVDFSAFTTTSLETQLATRQLVKDMLAKQAAAEDQDSTAAVSLLSTRCRRALHDQLPLLQQYCNWRVIYSTSLHGVSLRTMISSCTRAAEEAAASEFSRMGKQRAAYLWGGESSSASALAQSTTASSGLPPARPMLLVIELMPSTTLSFAEDGPGVQEAADHHNDPEVQRRTNRMFIGAYLSHLLGAETRRYYGDSETFVFQLLLPSPALCASMLDTSTTKIASSSISSGSTHTTTTVSAPQLHTFHSTGANSQYINCRSTSIVVGGGGGGSSLYIDSSLAHGATTACRTFGSPPLTEWHSCPADGLGTTEHAGEGW